jgi:hypothetical protein
LRAIRNPAVVSAPSDERISLATGMQPVTLMAGRVRPWDRRFVRLSDPVLAQVEHLARLAGVGVDHVVEFILTEALSQGLPQPGATREPPPPPPGKSRRGRPQRSADVIPIARNRGRARR